MQVAKLFSKSALFCATVISALTLSTAYAEGGFKVGYVSLDRLIAESAPAKKARATLDKEFKSREKALERNATSLRDAQQKYEKDFPNLTDEQRAARETEIGKNIEAFEAERTAFETDLSNAQNKLLQDLLKDANNVIRQIAEKDGYDLVIQEAVYIKPEYDMTQRVIDQLK
ncbi:MAG: OmpH family outer membrane protein [Burkholderiales bacterium]|nr:OmpH family outer membrane protein [Burkholderiales bacterium]MCE1176512.1 OmpH family outer membrane protein [Burkholderiales bacterium]